MNSIKKRWSIPLLFVTYYLLQHLSYRIWSLEFEILQIAYYPGGIAVQFELIKAIYVDAPDKSSGKRRQHIHIQYDGLGFIPLNELLAQEKA